MFWFCFFLLFLFRPPFLRSSLTRAERFSLATGKSVKQNYQLFWKKCHLIFPTQQQAGIWAWLSILSNLLTWKVSLGIKYKIRLTQGQKNGVPNDVRNYHLKDRPVKLSWHLFIITRCLQQTLIAFTVFHKFFFFFNSCIFRTMVIMSSTDIFFFIFVMTVCETQWSGCSLIFP